MNIKDFLLARIVEDETVARAATKGPWKWWNLEAVNQGWTDNGPNLEQDTDEWKTCEHYCRWVAGDVNHRGEAGKPGHEHRVTEEVIGSWGSDAHGISIENVDADHIARHDPARVLAECAAKRAVIEAFDPEAPDLDPYVGVSVMCLMAGAYADHADYQQEWRNGAGS